MTMLPLNITNEPNQKVVLSVVTGKFMSKNIMKQECFSVQGIPSIHLTHKSQKHYSRQKIDIL